MSTDISTIIDDLMDEAAKQAYEAVTGKKYQPRRSDQQNKNFPEIILDVQQGKTKIILTSTSGIEYRFEPAELRSFVHEIIKGQNQIISLPGSEGGYYTTRVRCESTIRRIYLETQIMIRMLNLIF